MTTEVLDNVCCMLYYLDPPGCKLLFIGCMMLQADSNFGACLTGIWGLSKHMPGLNRVYRKYLCRDIQG